MTFNIGTHYNPSATHITNAQEREYAGLETAVSSITAASTNASSTILAATSDTQIRIWGWSNATSGSVDNGHILTFVVTWADAAGDTAFNDTVDGTVTDTITHRTPNTTRLNNASWSAAPTYANTSFAQS